MTKEDKIFQMALAIAPIFAKEGITLQMNVLRNGQDIEKCTIKGKDIPHAYGANLKYWATTFVEELYER